jgi:hypothetical protein
VQAARTAIVATAASKNARGIASLLGAAENLAAPLRAKFDAGQVKDTAPCRWKDDVIVASTIDYAMQK